MIRPFPLSQSDHQMQRIRNAVEQHRNAPFRSADWLAGELMTICETAPANDAASPARAASAPSQDDVSALREAVTAAVEWLQAAPLESGICCCGNPVDGHGYGDGHAPVDDLRYSAMQVQESLRAALKHKGAGK